MLYYHNLDPSTIDWTPIFEQQIGGNSQLERYIGKQYQRGYGIFSRVFRFLIPILKSAGKEVGKELLTTAGKTISEIAAGDTIKEALKRNTKSGVHRLLEKGAEATVGKGKVKKRKRIIAIVRSAPLRKRRLQ